MTDDLHYGYSFGEDGPDQSPHITVCICTYRRPDMLRDLLRGLSVQDTGGLFTYSVVVADNDAARSGEGVVREFCENSGLRVTYCVEPRQGIALARNAAVQRGAGAFVAFIDDDEWPPRQWLVTLFRAIEIYGVDGVLGPVVPRFSEKPPRWVVQGRFYHRPTYPTGLIIDWRKGRTGNVLLRAEVFAGGERFRPEFRTGEDQDFFRRAIEKGRVFVWCNEAVAYETVPPTRWKRTFMFRRALLRGATSPLHPTFGKREVAKSIIAVPLYIIVLPVVAVMGQPRLMQLLVRLCDHLGRLLAVMGVNAVRQPYVT